MGGILAALESARMTVEEPWQKVDIDLLESKEK